MIQVMLKRQKNKMQIQPPIINIFEKAARKAGKTIMRDFGELENLQIHSKNLGDFVTNADIKVEKILLETLQYYFPKATYITEESGKIEGDDNIIVIDPIDGTTNFIHGIPFVSIVIGRLSNGEITDGVVFNPILNEFYWASKGKGAWCNNKRLRVSKRKNLIDCVIGTGIPHANRIYENYLNEIDSISKNCSGLRRLGSAALDLAFVASGKLDGFWENNLNLWDVSAGIILVKEAGGYVSETNGKEWTIDSKDILASNTNIHEIVINKLNRN
jgi:myo-inositol-1(or 4)-monophosphatase